MSQRFETDLNLKSEVLSMDISSPYREVPDPKRLKFEDDGMGGLIGIPMDHTSSTDQRVGGFGPFPSTVDVERNVLSRSESSRAGIPDTVV